MTSPSSPLAETLLPCPFCGTTEGLYPGYRGMGSGKPYQIDCCGCGIDFTPRDGMDVIAAWNRRALPSPTQVKAGETIGEALDVEEGVKICDAVLAWMVKYDLLDAGNEYHASDIVAVLDDLTTPSPISGDVVVTDAMVERAAKAMAFASRSDHDMAADVEDLWSHTAEDNRIRYRIMARAALATQPTTQPVGEARRLAIMDELAALTETMQPDMYTGGNLNGVVEGETS